MKRLILTATLVAFLAGGSAVPTQAEKSDDVYRQLDLFGTVFEQVRKRYVTDTTDKKLIEAAISGMLQSLDPHSSYMSPESFKEMRVQTRGEFGGLGIEVTMDKGLIKVVSPIDDTPAAKAGVQAGDLITHINGKPVLGLTLRDAVNQMRGKVGTDIKITIRRGQEKPFILTITRAIITVKSVRSQIYGNVGYIRVTSFTEQTDIGVRRALEEFKTKLGDKWAGVVLDLRNNPGGLLDQAVSVADVFLNQGEIVSTRGREKRISSRRNATKGDLAEGKPIVVLINGGSASASEIVAAALQDHRRAIVMGSQSFGKGSVQDIIPLSNGGAMRLTIARYYAPSGRSIQAKGVTPDIIVKQAKIEELKGPNRRERDLRGALDTKKPDDTSKKPEETKKPDDVNKKDDKSGADKGADAKKAPAAKDKPAADKAKETGSLATRDYQLARAIDLLNGLSLYERSKARGAVVKTTGDKAKKTEKK